MKHTYREKAMLHVDNRASCRATRQNVCGFNRNVFFAGLVSFFMDVSSEMVYPLVPLFLANTLGVNTSVIGLIEGVAESTASVLKVLSGWFSDRRGKRKWLMVMGYAISTLSRPLIALAPGWRQVMGSRFMDRFGKGVRTAPRDAIIVESTERSALGRAFGFHRAMDTSGAVVGPAVAFFLLGIFSGNYRTVFWFSMLPGILAVLLIIFFIIEKKKTIARGAERPKLTRGHFDWRFKFFICIATLFTLGNSSDAFLVLRAEQVGIPAVTIPLVYLLFNLVYSLTSLPAGMAADRFGSKRIILLGFILFAILYYGFATAASTQAVWILFGVYGLFMGLTEGIQKAFLATIMPAEFKATAFGVYTMAVGFAMLPASLIGGWLWEHVAPAATFYFGAGTAGAAAILFGIFIIALRGTIS